VNQASGVPTGVDTPPWDQVVESVSSIIARDAPLVIKQANPKQQKSKSWHRYLRLGGRKADLIYDLERKFVQVADTALGEQSERSPLLGGVDPENVAPGTNYLDDDDDTSPTKSRAQRARERQQQNKFNPGTGSADSKWQNRMLELLSPQGPKYIATISPENAERLVAGAIAAGIPDVRNFQRENVKPEGQKFVISVDLLATKYENPKFKHLASIVHDIVEQDVPGYDRRDVDSIQCNFNPNGVPCG